jgi:thiol-disulfide isomerase/thioredoxin
MKKIFLLLIFNLFCLANAHSQYAVIFKNTDSEIFPVDSMFSVTTIFRDIFDVSLSKYFKSQPINLAVSKGGHFIKFSTFWVKNNDDIEGYQKSFFLKPGDSVAVSFKNGKVVLEQTQNKNYEPFLALLDNHDLKIMEIIKTNYDFKSQIKQNKTLDSLNEILYKNLYNLRKQIKVDAIFFKILNQKIRIDYILNINLYFNKCRAIINYADVGNDNEYFKYLSDFKKNLIIPLNNFSGMNNYGLALDHYIRMKSYRFLNKENEFEILFNQIIKNFVGIHRDYALTRLMLQNGINSIQKDKNFALYSQNCKNSNFKKIVLSHLLDENVINNKEFLETKIIDMTNNKEIVFGDFLKENINNIIYIDFWASWCGSCKMQVPYLNKLSEVYKEVKFISINIDNDLEIAQKISPLWGFSNSKSFYLSPDSKLANLLAKPSIPRFTLILKNNLIFSIDAPRPSDPEIKTFFNKLLSEK